MSTLLPLIVSIDTEEDNWIPARTGITVENIYQLPKLQRRLGAIGLKVTYFTTYQVVMDQRGKEVMRDLAASGAEIGAHLHPWNTPPIEEPLEARNTLTCNLPATLQLAKLQRLTHALEESIGSRPTAFRAGRWALGAETVGALLTCRYKVDSSVTPLRNWAPYNGGPNFENAPLGPHYVAGNDGELRIREIPVSLGYSRRPFKIWRPVHRTVSEAWGGGLRLGGPAARLGLVRKIALSPEVHSSPEMFTLARNLIAEGVPFLHVFWHSPSLLPGLTPFIDSRGDAERLCRSIEAFVEKLAGIAPIVPVTLSQAVQMLEHWQGPTCRLAHTIPESRVQPIRARRPRVSSTKRLVIVSYHYPTDGAVGGLRWAALSKYLGRTGWTSRIVTAAPEPTTGASPGVRIESRSRLPTLRDAYRAVRIFMPHSPPTATRASDSAAPEPRISNGSILERLRLEAAVALALPDEGRGWVVRAAAATRRAIQRDKADVVVSSGPPHSAHLAAWLATRGLSCRWLVDLRDPWAGPISDSWRGHVFLRSFLGSETRARLERFVFRHCDAVICNAAPLARALRVRYPDLEVHFFPNAVDDETLPARLRAPLYRLEIVHVGTIYGARSLEPLLSGFRTFLNRHADATPQVCRVTVAGIIDGAARETLDSQIHAAQLEAFVSIVGTVPRPQALEMISRAHLVVVLAQDQEYQVPAKLYEAAALARRTLVVAEQGTAAWDEARRVGAVTLAPESSAAISELIADIWSGRGGNEGDRLSNEALYSQTASRIEPVLLGDAGMIND